MADGKIKTRYRDVTADITIQVRMRIPADLDPEQFCRDITSDFKPFVSDEQLKLIADKYSGQEAKDDDLPVIAGYALGEEERVRKAIEESCDFYEFGEVTDVDIVHDELED